jgi:hypothetical protein
MLIKYYLMDLKFYRTEDMTLWVLYNLLYLILTLILGMGTINQNKEIVVTKFSSDPMKKIDSM